MYVSSESIKIDFILHSLHAHYLLKITNQTDYTRCRLNVARSSER